MQVPEAPSLDSVASAGVVATIVWLLVVMVLGGMVATSLYMRAQVNSFNRIAKAIEGWPSALALRLDGMEKTIAGKLDMVDAAIEKLDSTSQRILRTCLKWEATEAPGRIVRKENTEPP